MKTVEWLSFIKSNVENRNPTQYIDDIKDVFNGYNSDTKKCNKHYQQCAYVIQNIFYNLFKQGGKTFSATLEDSYPLLEKWLVTQSNFKNMLELTRNTEISE